MTDLITFESKFKLDDKHSKALETINAVLPEVTRATALFNKTQSNFMDEMLTVSHLTPIRNLRQILAEMKKTRLALGDAYYSIQEKRLDIEDLEKSPGGKRKQLEIEKLEWQIACIQENVDGAIRKLANYSKQYQAIMDSHSLGDFNEEDFEAEEERYHICKAFEQGLNAARAHGGYIDEGNQIYFAQIGINGTVAQVCVTNYLNIEASMLRQGEEPTHEMQIEFIIQMSEKFEGCSSKFAQWKGQLVAASP